MNNKKYTIINSISQKNITVNLKLGICLYKYPKM